MRNVFQIVVLLKIIHAQKSLEFLPIKYRKRRLTAQITHEHICNHGIIARCLKIYGCEIKNRYLNFWGCGKSSESETEDRDKKQEYACTKVNPFAHESLHMRLPGTIRI